MTLVNITNLAWDGSNEGIILTLRNYETKSSSFHACNVA
jgi:hypothetical protein